MLFKVAFLKIIVLVTVYGLGGCKSQKEMVQGWNILSDDMESDLEIIRGAKDYNINQLQLSHHVVHFLNELEDPVKREHCNMLVDSAHKAGIDEVIVWDHSLYDLKYYPDEFKIESNQKINLDNPVFWTWLTAKLYRACARMYYGHRISTRGESFRTAYLAGVIREGVVEMQTTIPLISNYNVTYPVGGWDWKEDTRRATEYYYKPILESGWPELNIPGLK